MINLQNLNFKQKVYLTELVRRVIGPELQIGPDTFNSLKPGVLQFCFNNWNSRSLKKKVIEKIINKVTNKQILDGEFYVEPVQLEFKL